MLLEKIYSIDVFHQIEQLKFWISTVLNDLAEAGTAKLLKFQNTGHGFTEIVGEKMTFLVY